jgi:hypothetical protein
MQILMNIIETLMAIVPGILWHIANEKKENNK